MGAYLSFTSFVVAPTLYFVTITNLQVVKIRQKYLLNEENAKNIYTIYHEHFKSMLRNSFIWV